MHVLCVCTANVCRSPFLQLLLQQRLGAVDPGVEVTSAGTRALVGSVMDDRTRAALAARGVADTAVDGTSFRASALTPARLEAADLTLTATMQHRDATMRLAPRALKRTFTLLEFAAAVAEPGGSSDDAAALVRHAARRRGRAIGPLDVPDPVGVAEPQYRAVMDIIERAVDTIVDRWPRSTGPAAAL